jgi:hypothetical protein
MLRPPNKRENRLLRPSPTELGRAVTGAVWTASAATLNRFESGRDGSGDTLESSPPSSLPPSAVGEPGSAAEFSMLSPAGECISTLTEEAAADATREISMFITGWLCGRGLLRGRRRGSWKAEGGGLNSAEEAVEPEPDWLGGANEGIDFHDGSCDSVPRVDA